jgi:hypothetical protein
MFFSTESRNVNTFYLLFCEVLIVTSIAVKVAWTSALRGSG